jgi:hypothetical protein
MAFIGDDQAVPGGQFPRRRRGGTRSARWRHRRSRAAGLAAAELPGLDAKEFGDPGPPLIRERNFESFEGQVMGSRLGIDIDEHREIG